jgi:hypothetical protein
VADTEEAAEGMEDAAEAAAVAAGIAAIGEIAETAGRSNFALSGGGGKFGSASQFRYSFVGILPFRDLSGYVVTIRRKLSLLLGSRSNWQSFERLLRT